MPSRTTPTPTAAPTHLGEREAELELQRSEKKEAASERWPDSSSVVLPPGK